MPSRYDPVKKLAKDVTTETLHGVIPTKTTMELATGVIDMATELEWRTQNSGLIIISALLNFADYLRDQHLLMVSEQGGGKLVMKFLDGHSHEKTYLKKGEDIAKRLGVPFEEVGCEVSNSGT